MYWIIFAILVAFIVLLLWDLLDDPFDHWDDPWWFTEELDEEDLLRKDVEKR